DHNRGVVVRLIPPDALSWIHSRTFASKTCGTNGGKASQENIRRVVDRLPQAGLIDDLISERHIWVQHNGLGDDPDAGVEWAGTCALAAGQAPRARRRDPRGGPGRSRAAADPPRHPAAGEDAVATGEPGRPALADPASRTSYDRTRAE